MTLDSIIDHYRHGRITSTHAAHEVAHMVPCDNFDGIMSALPESVMASLLELVAEYQPNNMISFGTATDPGPERISYIQEWINRHRPIPKSSIAN